MCCRILPVTALLFAIVGITCGKRAAAAEKQPDLADSGHVQEGAAPRPRAADLECESTTARPNTELRNEDIPEDTCILEQRLPRDAKLRIDGDDFRLKRRIHFRGLERGKYTPCSVEISYSDGSKELRRILLFGGRTVTLSYHKTPQVEVQTVLNGEQLKPVKRITPSANGPRIEISSDDGTAAIWDLARGEMIGQIKSNVFDSLPTARSGDGKLLLMRSAEDTASLRDTIDRQERSQFRGHRGTIFGLDLSADGKHVLTGGADRTARLWDASNGKQIRRLEGHLAPVRAVAFSSDCRRVWTGSDDGTVRLWDIATGDELIRLATSKKDDGWLTLTPEGLFDGSRQGKEMLAHRVGKSGLVVPVDRFFRDLYYPGLLSEIWSGGRPVLESRRSHSVAPKVEILPRDPPRERRSKLTVDVVVSGRGTGIRAPWMFHNGQPGPPPENVRVHGGVFRCDFTIDLALGRNQLVVCAASSDGLWESEPAIMTFDSEGSLPQPELYVLAIGINRYSGGGRSDSDLRGCVLDAKRMVRLFQEHHSPYYARVHVTPLYDEDATRDGILEAIHVIARRATLWDTLVVYFAGHGWTCGQRYYFLTHEFRTEEGQTINDAVRQWGLPVDEFGGKLGEVPALKRVLILDADQSGSVTKSERSLFEFRGAVERFARSQGVFSLAASAEDAPAFEHPMTGDMGILTFTLLAGMGAIEDKHSLLGRARIESTSPNGEVDVLDWFRFAQDHVPRLAEKLAGQKDYHIEMRGREPDFPLLRVRDE